MFYTLFSLGFLQVRSNCARVPDCEAARGDSRVTIPGGVQEACTHCSEGQGLMDVD